MSSSDSPPRTAKARIVRADGWTAERQLRFLDTLVCTRNIAQAAAHARMSRESAYRLRDRRDGALFGLLWDRILAPGSPPREVHTCEPADGQIMRLIGTNFRRECGDFIPIGSKGAQRR